LKWVCPLCLVSNPPPMFHYELGTRTCQRGDQLLAGVGCYRQLFLLNAQACHHGCQSPSKVSHDLPGWC
jgi:hypothetical protein